MSNSGIPLCSRLSSLQLRYSFLVVMCHIVLLWLLRQTWGGQGQGTRGMHDRRAFEAIEQVRAGTARENIFGHYLLFFSQHVHSQ